MYLAICFYMKRKSLNAFEHNRQNNGTELNQVCCAVKRLGCWALARLDHTSPAQPNISACLSTALRLGVNPVQMWMSIIMSPKNWGLRKDWIISSVFYQGRKIQIKS